MSIFQSLFGFLVFLGVAWLISENRKKLDARKIIGGVALQFALGVLLLKAPLMKEFFLGLNSVVEVIESATTAGTSFVFGYLGGGNLPFEEPFPGASFILAFRALPIILVMSALTALLFYWRILPLLVRGFSLLLQKTMGIGGALGLSSAANIFVGMIEAPMFVRPYVSQMTRSELFAMMTCGMATVAGTVLVLYASILKDVIPGSLGHILTASIISAPAALLIAQLMVPEKDEITTGAKTPPQEANGAMDAITTGTMQGVGLFIPVVAMLLVLVALVALCNSILSVLPQMGGAEITLQRILGILMAPVVWLMGVPWAEAGTAGMLMGTKTVLNELLAYLDLAKLEPGALSERSKLIMTYAMCGFANFGSLGIMIGGLGAMAPDRRDEVVALGIRSIVAGTLATCMTGCVVGILT